MMDYYLVNKNSGDENYRVKFPLETLAKITFMKAYAVKDMDAVWWVDNPDDIVMRLEFEDGTCLYRNPMVTEIAF